MISFHSFDIMIAFSSQLDKLELPKYVVDVFRFITFFLRVQRMYLEINV